MAFNSSENITIHAATPTFDNPKVDYYTFEVGTSNELVSDSPIIDLPTENYESNGSKEIQASKSSIDSGSNLKPIEKPKPPSIHSARAISSAQKRVSLQMSAKLHRAAKLAALDEDETLNSLLVRVLRQYLAQRDEDNHFANYRKN